MDIWFGEDSLVGEDDQGLMGFGKIGCQDNSMGLIILMSIKNFRS